MRAFLLLGLLQAGRCADLTQNAEYLRAGLQIVAEGLEKVSAPNSPRQIAINSLMKTVQGTERLTPQQDTTLGQVVDLLEDVLAAMVNQTIERQTELGLITGEIAHCNDAERALESELAANVSQLSQDLTDCRSNEKTLFDADATACKAMADYLGALTAPNCIKPGSTRAEIDAWWDMISKGLSFFSGAKDGFVDVRDNCKDSTGDLEDENARCDGIQANYEVRFCEWRMTLTQRCSDITTCHAEKTVLHENRTDRILPLSEQRVKEAGLVMHVLCLIDKLRTGVDIENFQTDCPVPDNAALSQYSNSAVTIPDAEACTTAPVAVYPGHPDWDDLYDYDAGVEAAPSGSC